jgi:hypothetical protein
MTDPSFDAPFVTRKLEQLSSAHKWVIKEIVRKKIEKNRILAFMGVLLFVVKSAKV